MKKVIFDEGDFVTAVNNEGKAVSIYKNGAYYGGSIIEIFSNINSDDTLHFNKVMRNVDVLLDVRLSTESEKQRLLSAMKSAGKDWDAEKKKVVDYKWKPKVGEMYWTINPHKADGVEDYKYEDDICDKFCRNIGLMFKTKDEAMDAIAKIRRKVER